MYERTEFVTAVSVTRNRKSIAMRSFGMGSSELLLKSPHYLSFKLLLRHHKYVPWSVVWQQMRIFHGYHGICSKFFHISNWTYLTTFFYSSSTLGIYVSYADSFSPYEIIPISLVDSPLALIPIHLNKINWDLWISISFDHVCIYGIYRTRY